MKFSFQADVTVNCGEYTTFRRAMHEPGQPRPSPPPAPDFSSCRRLRPDERDGGVRGVGEITSVSAMDRLLSDICGGLNSQEINGLYDRGKAA